jgi:hypothetical protein
VKSIRFPCIFDTTNTSLITAISCTFLSQDQDTQNVEKVCSTWKLSRKIPGTAKLEIFVKSDVKTILDVPVQ